MITVFSSSCSHVLLIIGRAILQYRPNFKDLICTIGSACPEISLFQSRESTHHWRARLLKSLLIAAPINQVSGHARAKITLLLSSNKWTTKSSSQFTSSTLSWTPIKPNILPTTCRIETIWYFRGQEESRLNLWCQITQSQQITQLVLSQIIRCKLEVSSDKTPSKIGLKLVR